MTLIVICTLLGLIFAALSVHLCNSWLKNTLMVLGYILVFLGVQRAGMDDKSWLEVAVFISAMILFAVMIKSIIKIICTKFASQYPKWIKA